MTPRTQRHSSARPALLGVIIPTVLAAVLLAGCGSDSKSEGFTPTTHPGAKVTTTLSSTDVSSPKVTSPVTRPTGSGGGDADGADITLANICSFIDTAAAEAASGVATLVPTAVDNSDNGSILCTLHNPAEAAAAYGTVALVYTSGLSQSTPTDTFQGLAGGSLIEADPAGVDIEAQLATAGRPASGRGQTTVKWVYKNYEIKVNARGPGLTDRSLVTLAQAVNAKLHA
jgi:hypothetical protein